MTTTTAAPAPLTAGTGGTHSHVAELHAIRAQAMAGPSEQATAAQHAKGKLTARERIGLLLDEGSFQEVEQLRLSTGRPGSAWRPGSRTRTG